jgi:hypothetical protein
LLHCLQQHRLELPLLRALAAALAVVLVVVLAAAAVTQPLK